MNSVFDCMAATSHRYPQHEFLHIPHSACKSYSEQAITTSYAQAIAAIEALQQHYRNAGYGCGHRVALLLQNRPDFLWHWLALNGIGASVVPVNDDMSAAEQAYIVGHSEACLLLYPDDLQHKIDDLRPLLPQTVALLASRDIAQLPTPKVPATASEAKPDSECALLYTSGSTGQPKGCILTNEYFLLSGQRYVTLGGLCAMVPAQERLLTPLPLVHMNAMACSTLAMIMTGGCLIQLDRFHPRSWWQTVRESRASIVHYLGVMPAMLLNSPPATNDDFSGQIKFAFGAGVNPKHHAPFEQRFGFPLIEAWGMTETGNNGAIIAHREPRHVGQCCFGVAPDHLELRLVDESGNDVPAGTAGELLIRYRGDNPRRGFFSGYLKNAEATAEAWAGGWFHTGDVVRADEQGALFFVDRRKNVIRRSGENISALEVEAALAEDPAVAMAVVCPVPDEIRGDEVMACIIPGSSSRRDQQEAERIAGNALSSLVYFKIPGYIAFVDSLPLTASEKPRRADIKTLARTLLEAGECYDVRHLKKRSSKGTT